jgi:hypothetical protein
MRAPCRLTAGLRVRDDIYTSVFSLKEFHMKAQLAVISIVAALVLFSAPASAKGCVKGAAVGGVADHVVGHHSVLGAAAGCAVGRHRANKAAKQREMQDNGSARKG